MFSLLLLFFSVARPCQVHTCDEHLPADVCRDAGETVKYAACSGFCRVDRSGNGTCVEKRMTLGVPGSVCRENSECFLRKCSRGRCKGIESGERCGHEFECAVGLRCRKGVCIDLIKTGDSGCETVSDCETQSTCFFGTCVPLFSKELGERTECSAYGYSFLCKSGRCWDSTCVGKPDIETKYPSPCESDLDCAVAKSNFRSYAPKCVCGLSATTEKHCSLRVTDDLFEEYLSLVRDWVSDDGIRRCQPTSKFAVGCVESNWDRTRARKLREIATTMREPPLQDADQCVRDAVANSSLSAFFIF